MKTVQTVNAPPHNTELHFLWLNLSVLLSQVNDLALDVFYVSAFLSLTVTPKKGLINPRSFHFTLRKLQPSHTEL